MRAVEVLNGFAQVILVILTSRPFGGGTLALFAAMDVPLWLSPAAIVRAQAKSLAKRALFKIGTCGESGIPDDVLCRAFASLFPGLDGGFAGARQDVRARAARPLRADGPRS